MATPTVPLGTILDKLLGDASLAAALADEVDATLRPSDPTHRGLQQTARDLADRLAVRHAELADLVAKLQARGPLGRAELLP
jgi:hypothetical protein